MGIVKCSARATYVHQVISSVRRHPILLRAGVWEESPDMRLLVSLALGWVMHAASLWLATQDNICMDLALIQVISLVSRPHIGQQPAPNLP